MGRLTFALFIAFGCAAAVSVAAKPLTVELPEETAAFAPGPNLDVVQSNCGACHSADYILAQPRTIKDKRGFWQAEVNKMMKAYHAPIKEEDAPKIVDYLAATY
jgi:sulfite dehydrogenase (cytochrome) subunit B